MSRRKVNIFTFIICFIYLVSAIYSLLKKEFGTIGLIASCIGVNIVLLISNKKLNRLVDNNIYVILSLFIMASILFGTSFGFYDSIKYYDDFLHLWSGIVSTNIAYILIRCFINSECIKGINKIFIITFLFMFTMGLASLWEVAEFSLDSLFGMNTQIGGLSDTMIDMIDALAGGIISIPYFIIKIKKNLSQS